MISAYLKLAVELIDSDFRACFLVFLSEPMASYYRM